MTETVFAREQVKEFPDENIFTADAFLYKEFPWLAEYFFVSNRPRYTCDRNRKYEEQGNLVDEWIHAEATA